MTDAFISSLAQTTSPKVISRTSVKSYRNADRPIPEIARTLSVDAIVEGSVLRAGEDARTTAQLIHGATDRHLCAGTCDGRLSEMPELQSDLARSIANEVRANLTRPDQPRPAAASPVDPAALNR
jgi:TolB-like protein